MPKFISNDLELTLEKHISQLRPSKVAILVDENTKAHCLPLIASIKHDCIVEIESGEKNKQLETCSKIWQELTLHNFDRKSLLLNLGGGVIGDMGGFCAATYKRGIAFINLPTTLLSMVDASVGGKLGIDFGPFKNHIGMFQLPNEVFVYPPFLNTLAPREIKSGFAEIIKHALIKDAPHWQIIKQTALEDFNWDSTIQRSVKIKEDVVTQDPREQGLRKILNFGHTIGHAIESYYLDKNRLLHGEAIAIGMVCEAYLATIKTGLLNIDLQEIANKIIAIYGHSKIEEKDIEAITAFLIQDKKNVNSTIQAALLNKIGEANFDIAITAEDTKNAILYYNTLHISV